MIVLPEQSNSTRRASVNRSHDATPHTAAFQGTRGAFGEEAVRLLWNGGATAVPSATFADALERLRRGDVAWAVIPVWNSIIGPIVSATLELRRHAEAIDLVHHVEVPVELCLLARPGTMVEDIRYVGSHPAALAQCRRFFAAHPRMLACDASDTAGAARQLADGLFDVRIGRSAIGPRPWHARLSVESERCLAVVASGRAAELYGLDVLCSGVQDEAYNVTRFAAVRRRGPARP
jgi:prephenate dehydratase